ncbi:MAG: uroporphyrinogen decarboxylase family protein [Opitutaceae bacterium]
MINALCCGPPNGRVPHFELSFLLTMEAFGRIHPSHRCYRQWLQMSAAEQDLHRRDVADLHLAVARRFEQAGILFHAPGGWCQEDLRLSVLHLRELSNLDYLVLLHGDATYAIPSGAEMMDFVSRLADEPEAMKNEAQRRVDAALARAGTIKEWGLVDGFCLCADYCFNDNPFLSPAMFGEFVTPFLHQLVKGYRDMGFYVIKHTDGNIMPIVHDLLDANPHALHSLDPQGGVDLARMKRLVTGRVCLIGNVNCGLLQSGTEEEVVEDVRRSLREGLPGGGYIFGTSNCIFTGLPLHRYALMMDIWRREGVYD